MNITLFKPDDSLPFLHLSNASLLCINNGGEAIIRASVSPLRYTDIGYICCNRKFIAVAEYGHLIEDDKFELAVKSVTPLCANGDRFDLHCILGGVDKRG